MMGKQIFILVLLLLNAMPWVFAEDVSLSLSQGTVGINESFTAIFSSRERVQEQPDFAPLQTDFTILSNSQSHQTSFINGSITQEARWTLELMGKREGNLIIPSIQFGKYSSEAKTIQVGSSHSTKQDDTLFLETEISPKNSVYEQTQLIYTVRLYTSMKIAQAALSEIKVNDQDAMIEKLGDDTQYEHYHSNGNRYIVVERKYAVFPQHSGELVFSPVVFEGKAVVGGNSFFDIQTQFKRVYSDQEKVEVKPIPAPFQKNNWLAAYDVKLTEEWSADPSNVPLGEPITWTLTLTADGCLGSQIPTIPLNLPGNLKQYLDKPQIYNQSNANGNVGVRQIKVALIAANPGKITLPEITVKWWDLNTDQLRETQIPAQTIQVQGDPVALNTPLIDRTTDSPLISQPTQAPLENFKDTQTLPIWAWCLIGLNGIWIVGLFFMVYKKMALKISVKPDSLKQIKLHLKKACQANDPKKAEVCLLVWAGYLFPKVKPLNITGIKQHLSKDLQTAIDELNQALYGPKKTWKGDIPMASL